MPVRAWKCLVWNTERYSVQFHMRHRDLFQTFNRLLTFGAAWHPVQNHWDQWWIIHCEGVGGGGDSISRVTVKEQSMLLFYFFSIYLIVCSLNPLSYESGSVSPNLVKKGSQLTKSILVEQPQENAQVWSSSKLQGDHSTMIRDKNSVLARPGQSGTFVLTQREVLNKWNGHPVKVCMKSHPNLPLAATAIF